MANNPNVNKVVYGNQTIMDLTNDTVTPEDVAEGVTFHDRSGAQQTGTGNYYSPNDTAETDIADGDYFPFFDVSAESGSGAKRKSLWSNIKAKLKAYFDTLYATVNGHTMIPVSNDIATIANLTSSDANNNYVANAYSIQRWANCDVISLWYLAPQGIDTIGDWETDWKASGASRDGWLWSEDLYQVLKDSNDNPVLDIEITPVYDIENSETISVYAYRIDDDIDQTVNGQTVHGGAIAFKFNQTVATSGGVYVGINLKHQRINKKFFTVISE